MEKIKNYLKQSELIERTAELIKKGKVIICPTDTVYGLICNLKNKKAVERLFKIKKRKKDNPVPIFVENLKQAKKLVKINKKQEEFLKSIWPGKTTAVLKRKKIKGKIYGVNKETIALRIPDYKLINNLLKKTKILLSGTSANVSGKGAETRIEGVLNQFKNKKEKPDFVIDKGNLKYSKPSTIIDLTSTKFRKIR